MKYILMLIGLAIFLTGFLLIIIVAHTPFDTTVQKETALVIAGVIGIIGLFVGTFGSRKAQHYVLRLH